MELIQTLTKAYTDDPGAVEGTPAHVQIFGKPMMDEELIEIMKVVEAILKEAS